MASGGNDGYYDEDGDFDSARDYGVEPEPTGGGYRDLVSMGDIKKSLNDNPEKINALRKRYLGDSSSSKDALKKNEDTASKDPNKGGRGGDKDTSLAQKEGNVGSDKDKESGTGLAGDFNNAVKGIKEIKTGNAFKGAKHLKAAGPIATILAVIVFFAGAAFFGQASMGFSLLSQITESFDSVNVSMGIRSKTFLRFQTNGKNTSGCIKAHYFRPDEFKPTKRQIKRLGAQGITFDNDSDGVMVMKYNPDPDNPDSKVKTIVADDSQAGDGRIAFSTLFDSDADFRSKYNNGSKTWRKGAGYWYDSSSPGFFQVIGNATRNLWKKFKGDTETSQEDMKTTVNGEADSDSMKGSVHATEIETEEETKVDATTGKETTTTELKAETQSDTETTITKADTVDTDGKTPAINGKLKTIAQSAMGGAATAANVYCMVADSVGAITAVVAAYQALQIIKMSTAIFEGIQKTQAGDGTNAPYHEIGNALTQETESTYEEVGGVKASDGDSNEFVVDESKTNQITRYRSAMESEMVGATYDRSVPDYNDASIRSFNVHEMSNNVWKGFSEGNGVIGALTGVIGNVASNINVSASAFQSCTIAKLAAATVQAGIDAVSAGVKIAACIGTAGVGCAVEAAWEGIKSFSKTALKSIIASVVVSMTVKHVTKVLMRSVITEVAGEDLGTVLIKGGNMVMGRNHLYSGGAVASKESYGAYLQQQDKIIAENAREEREARSPFDITSKYTFLGSLASRMIPLASKMTSVSSALSGVSSVLNNAISSLIPNSSAIGAGISSQAAADMTAKVNPYLAEIGGIGDATGEQYIITDVTTLDSNPADIVNKVDSLSNGATGEEKNLVDVTDTSGENVPKIGKNSKLAKFISFCGTRQSPFGMADQNITNIVDKIGTAGGNIGQAIANGLGLVGDIIDIASNTVKLQNIGWISGRSCVIGNKRYNDSVEESIDWEEASVYQRFIEDQRLAEAEGLVEESAVTQYLAEYYEEHPLDNSLEGVLARYSGLTKDNVIAAMDLLDVANFVAEYEPANLYPYPKSEDELPQILFEEENINPIRDMIAVKDVVYNNIRYRNYAA